MQPPTPPPPPTPDYNFHISTPRLYISHFNPTSDTHCAFTVRLLNSASSLKYSPARSSTITDNATARTFLQGGSERVAKTGWGRFLVSLREPAPDSLAGHESEVPFEVRSKDLTPIGVVSMQRGRFLAAGVAGPKIPDVGFNMLAEYHGRGYATEAALALMKWFREEKGIQQFAAITDEKNEEAKKTLKRLGFEDRGLRGVVGVMDGGNKLVLSVWTIGVEDGDEALEALGL